MNVRVRYNVGQQKVNFFESFLPPFLFRNRKKYESNSFSLQRFEEKVFNKFFRKINCLQDMLEKGRGWQNALRPSKILSVSCSPEAIDSSKLNIKRCVVSYF